MPNTNTIEQKLAFLTWLQDTRLEQQRYQAANMRDLVPGFRQLEAERLQQAYDEYDARVVEEIELLRNEISEDLQKLDASKLLPDTGGCALPCGGSVAFSEMAGFVGVKS